MKDNTRASLNQTLPVHSAVSLVDLPCKAVDFPDQHIHIGAHKAPIRIFRCVDHWLATNIHARGELR